MSLTAQNVNYKYKLEIKSKNNKKYYDIIHS